MEYRLSLTPRMVLLGTFSLLALLVLMLLLGMQLGRRMATDQPVAKAVPTQPAQPVQAVSAPLAAVPAAPLAAVAPPGGTPAPAPPAANK
jgi:hypothetical protein